MNENCRNCGVTIGIMQGEQCVRDHYGDGGVRCLDCWELEKKVEARRCQYFDYEPYGRPDCPSYVVTVKRKLSIPRRAMLPWDWEQIMLIAAEMLGPEKAIEVITRPEEKL